MQKNILILFLLMFTKIILFLKNYLLSLLAHLY